MVLLDSLAPLRIHINTSLIGGLSSLPKIRDKICSKSTERANKRSNYKQQQILREIAKNSKSQPIATSKLRITKQKMVLESIDIENNNNMECCGSHFYKPKVVTEEEMENQLLAKILHLLPEGYNLPTDISQYELIMYTIQYINALQTLTRSQ